MNAEGDVRIEDTSPPVVGLEEARGDMGLNVIEKADEIVALVEEVMGLNEESMRFLEGLSEEQVLIFLERVERLLANIETERSKAKREHVQIGGGMRWRKFTLQDAHLRNVRGLLDTLVGIFEARGEAALMAHVRGRIEALDGRLKEADAEIDFSFLNTLREFRATVSGWLGG